MLNILRAEHTWQQAGAYYVRIQGMARQYHIALEQEFDAHDTPRTKYIVLLEDDFPIATCRLFKSGEGVAEIGRVVVLPEYRGKGYGRRVVSEAERWLKELGYAKVALESRDVAVDFYRKMGYAPDYSVKLEKGMFPCVYMEKQL